MHQQAHCVPRIESSTSEVCSCLPTMRPAANLGGSRASPRLLTPKPPSSSLVYRCSSLRSVRARCGAAAASSSAAAAAADGSDGQVQQAARGDAPAADKRSRRKESRKPAPGPTTVVATAPAAASGVLPEVLAATWPDAFPTLSAARRGVAASAVCCRVHQHARCCKQRQCASSTHAGNTCPRTPTTMTAAPQRGDACSDSQGPDPR